MAPVQPVTLRPGHAHRVFASTIRADDGSILAASYVTPTVRDTALPNRLAAHLTWVDNAYVVILSAATVSELDALTASVRAHLRAHGWELTRARHRQRDAILAAEQAQTRPVTMSTWSAANPATGHDTATAP